MWILVLLVVVVICVGLFITRGRGEPVSDERLEEFDVRLTHEARVAIGTAVAKRNKILAIKLYRQHTGADLVTAKAAIDKWSKGVHG